MAQQFGVLRSEGYSERAIFVIDRQGLIRYVDVHDIDDQPDNEVLFDVLAGLSSTWAARPVRSVEFSPRTLKSVQAKSKPFPEPEARVVLYCTPWCPACRRAREYLKSNNIAYQEIDISRDRTAAQRVRGWANGFETTPTFDIQGTIIVNFDRTKLDKALGIG